MILLGCLLVCVTMAMPAAAENAPGVTDSEIKIGQTMPYTGPASRFSAPGLAEMAYLKMINDQGGVSGRKINLISVDDGYLPWRTGDETRRLVEVERVAFTSVRSGPPLSLPLRSISTSGKFRSCSSTAALTLGQLQGDALHDWRRAPELSSGSAFLHPLHSGTESKCKNLHPLSK